LDIQRSHLYTKMKKYNIEKEWLSTKTD
jgi:DNA-binding NtrC family response regulator